MPCIYLYNETVPFSFKSILTFAQNNNIQPNFKTAKNKCQTIYIILKGIQIKNKTHLHIHLNNTLPTQFFNNYYIHTYAHLFVIFIFFPLFTITIKKTCLEEIQKHTHIKTTPKKNTYIHIFATVKELMFQGIKSLSIIINLFKIFRQLKWRKVVKRDDGRY